MQRRAEVTPREVLIWEMLGYMHSIRGDHAAATEAFGKAVVTGAGQDNNALCLLGSSLAQQKQHLQAERVFKAACASPEFTRAWAGLARCQSAQGEDSPCCCSDLVKPSFLCSVCGEWCQISLLISDLQRKKHLGFGGSDADLLATRPYWRAIWCTLCK